MHSARKPVRDSVSEVRSMVYGWGLNIREMRPALIHKNDQMVSLGVFIPRVISN